MLKLKLIPTPSNAKCIKFPLSIFLFVLALPAFTLPIPAKAQTSPVTPAPITAFEAHYIAQAKGVPFKGKAVRKLTEKDGLFQFSMKAKSFLTSIVEHSEFRWISSEKTPEGDLPPCTLRPTHYRYERSGFSKDRKRSIRFDWNSSKATYQDKKNETAFNWEGELTDKLSEQLAVQCHLKMGDTDFTIRVAEKDTIKEHHFKVLNEEMVETGIGPIKTVKLKRIRPAQDRRSTTLWLAPSLDYLLVKLVQGKKAKENSDKKEQSFVITLDTLKKAP